MPSVHLYDLEVSGDGPQIFKCAGSGLTVPRLFQSVYIPFLSHVCDPPSGSAHVLSSPLFFPLM